MITQLLTPHLIIFTETSSLSAAGAVPSGKPRLVSRMGIQQYLDVGDEWRPREWTGNEGQVSLSFEYRVTCLPDYYGDACDKTCRARNDTFGHYTCSDQGDKICLSGWSGSYCEKRKCSFILFLVRVPCTHNLTHFPDEIFRVFAYIAFFCTCVLCMCPYRFRF